MANSLGTTNGALVLQRVLPTLLARFPLLSQITTNFTSDAMDPLFNQTVYSRVVVASTASDYSTSTGYVATDRTTVDVPVVIDQHKHHTIAVNDQERSSTNRNLIEEMGDTAAHALGTAVMTTLFGKILAAAYDQAYNVTAPNFDRSHLVAIDTAMANLNIPDQDRFMVLHPSWYGNLNLDTLIVSNQVNPSSTAVESGKLSAVQGFNISRYSALPSNSENLAGIAGVKDALVIASRVPVIPSGDVMIPGNIISATDERTGLTIQLRDWYDIKLGTQSRTITLMYGCAVGYSQTGSISRRLIRIVNANP